MEMSTRIKCGRGEQAFGVQIPPIFQMIIAFQTYKLYHDMKRHQESTKQERHPSSFSERLVQNCMAGAPGSAQLFCNFQVI